jgi:hypothetical protein
MKTNRLLHIWFIKYFLGGANFFWMLYKWFPVESISFQLYFVYVIGHYLVVFEQNPFYSNKTINGITINLFETHFEFFQIQTYFIC